MQTRCGRSCSRRTWPSSCSDLNGCTMPQGTFRDARQEERRVAGAPWERGHSLLAPVHHRTGASHSRKYGFLANGGRVLNLPWARSLHRRSRTFPAMRSPRLVVVCEERDVEQSPDRVADDA